MLRRDGGGKRRGTTAPIVALSLTALVGIAACAIDIGYVAGAAAQLQAAADAAALAGARQLPDLDELKGSPSQGAEITATRGSSQATSAANSAGGVSLLLDANPSNASGGDVVVGYLPQPRTSSTPASMMANASTPAALSPPLLWVPSIVNLNVPFITPPTVSGTGYYSYNATQVTVHRDTTRNGPLNLLFGGFIGTATSNLSATATATYEDNIIGGTTYPNWPGPSKLLPFAMDVNTFAAIAAGDSTLDLYKYNPNIAVPPGTFASRVSFADPTVSSLLGNLGSALSILLNPQAYGFSPASLIYGPVTPALQALLPGDGIKEALLVPLAVSPMSIGGLNVNLSAGNFGTLYIGTAAKGNIAEFERQILQGVSQSDFATIGGKLQLGSGGTVQVTGDTGLAATLKSTLLSIQGQPRIMPLYSTTATTPFPQLPGVDATYNIVGFGGVTLIDVLDIPAILGVPAVTNPLTGQVLVPAIPASTASLKLFVQPCFVIDGCTVGGGWPITQATGARTSRFIYRPLTLTR